MKKENIPLSLKTIPKETPFTVPDGYFEQFALNIDAQIAPKRIVRPLIVGFMQLPCLLAL